jgi:hypothetical protein
MTSVGHIGASRAMQRLVFILLATLGAGPAAAQVKTTTVTTTTAPTQPVLAQPVCFSPSAYPAYTFDPERISNIWPGTPAALDMIVSGATAGFPPGYGASLNLSDFSHGGNLELDVRNAVNASGSACGTYRVALNFMPLPVAGTVTVRVEQGQTVTTLAQCNYTAGNGGTCGGTFPEYGSDFAVDAWVKFAGTVGPDVRAQIVSVTLQKTQ